MGTINGEKPSYRPFGNLVLFAEKILEKNMKPKDSLSKELSKQSKIVDDAKK